MNFSPGTWTIDPTRSSVGFRVRHVGFATARGTFSVFAGVLDLADDGAGTASGTVQVASVETGDPSRDEFLQSPDFFDAEAFGELAFTSTELLAAADGSIRVTGELTIRGRRRSVTFAGTPADPRDATSAALHLIGEMSRASFGLTFTGPSNALVGDKVTVELRLVAVRA
jgi:polyisoprenoid-binding protein YceI